MRAFVAVILMALLVPASKARAQSPQADTGPFYRYIILVDGSSAMGRRKEAVAQTIGELIYNGFDGQAQSGDIFGIWTFQDTVDANSVPAQRWTLNNRQIMAANAVKHLTSFKYRKRSNLDAAVAEMVRATKVSKEVTLFLVSDGNEVIYGTPYDLDISTTFVLHRQELSTAKQPFITAIAARDGRMQAWAVEAGDGKVTVPRIPEEDPPGSAPKPTTTARPSESSSSPKASSPVSPPKSTAKTPTDTLRRPEPPPTLKKTETSKPPSPPLQTFAPPPSKPAPVVVQTVVPQAKPPVAPTITSTPTPSPSPLVESETKPLEPVKITTPRSNNNTINAQPRSAQLTRSRSSSRQFPGTTKSLPKPAVTTATVPKDHSTPTPSPAIPTARKPGDAPAPATAVTTQSSNSVAAAPTTASPVSSPVTATNAAPAPASGDAPATVKPPTDSIDISPAPAPAPTAAQTGIILPADEPTSRTRYLFLALTLLLVTGIMVFLALRRSRSPSQASLISQSFDRERN